MSEAERLNIYGPFGIAIICTDRILRSALVVPDYHSGWNSVRVRILGRHHVGLEGSGRQHRAGPNDGDGTAAPPLDPGDARRATAIHYLRLLQKHYCQFIRVCSSIFHVEGWQSCNSGNYILFLPAEQCRCPGGHAGGRHRDSSHHNIRSALHWNRPEVAGR